MTFITRFLSQIMVVISALLISFSVSAQSPQYDLLKAIDRQEVQDLNNTLQKGVSPDTRRRSDGMPAIVLAAQTGNIAIIKALLDGGANVNLGDRLRGETALMIRSTAGDTNAVKLLLTYNADPNRADIGQETALMKAVRGRKFKTAQALIEAGADPNVQDLTGKTALEYAKLSKSRRFIRLLQDAGATY
ncbi:ankyrin repeat domain-containing protein [Kordiimonas aquimaris]|uniref:ankyrin repeat domain-containing protein n=1 Tax=Kordiimonas aquimaris TaxID=707591 RepID=UPI0021CE5B1F|nr:ankyrin repeat domain-containing protein [Kordiimonas aquimaris]